MGLLLGRVGYLQLLNRPMLERQADQRSLRTQIIPADRGTIVDRNGHPLALSVASKDVIADPFRIEQLHSDLNSPKWQYLASALDMPLSQLQQIITSDLNVASSSWVEKSSKALQKTLVSFISAALFYSTTTAAIIR